ncbi:MAG: hypothetical protein PHF97_11945 [Bacteroidales bacterium]|nr:hypothetical protein [Bacteroidales bacterium]MDD4604500.1 hypothetical protein [Bacteroidales bacterium]
MKKEKQPPQKTVKALLPRADKAFKNKFYLESALTVSMILEIRIRTLIKRIEKSNPGIGFNLEQCLKRLKYLHLSGKDQNLMKTFEIQLIDDLRNWKNQRNAVLNDLTEIHVSPKRLEKLAQDGMGLLKEFTKANKQFKKGLKDPLQK